MKRIVMEGPRKSKVVEVDIPRPNDHQILVKVTYTGMCHSEWYPWSTASPGQLFGHEPVGVVAETGRAVTRFRVGDRVTGLGAGYAEYILMSERCAVPVPDNLSDVDAIAEPLSCLLSAASRMPLLLPGDPVAVVGAGYMGLGMISLFRLRGAGKIVAVDPREEARDNARRFGATEVYAPEELPADYRLNWANWGEEDLARSVEDNHIFELGFQNVMEFAGTRSALTLASEMVRAHGLLCIGGYHNDGPRCVDFTLWNVKAMTALNAHERRVDFQTECCRHALDLLSSGRWDFKGVTNHIYTMEEFDRANEEMESKPRGYIKAAIRCAE
ncbi:MAG TPA: alcohol dehydrogenase catalytic domain-containing protein [Firmicutes bacterium]|nr:alcohol dehydrogenase catalytic domain-containing protein [Bacillota bacterium]